jgi:PAS domain S-box-containing protein
MEELTNLLARNGLLPHGYCFQWSPGLLWTLVGADGAIALSYFSIPLVILAYSRRRPGVNLGHVAVLFSAFIFACGITHVMDVWTIWQPDYVLHAATKVITAAVSVFTAVMLWRLLPQALRIPSSEELQGALSRLQAEVALRRSAEGDLAELEQNLAATLAAIGAGFISTDDQGRVTRLNPVAERITGWPMAEALGMSVWQVFERAGRPSALQARNPVDVLLELGWSVEQPHHLVCVSRDGGEVPVELHAQVTRDDAGVVRGIALIFRDVSRLSSAEADVRRLAAVVESSSDAIITKTLDGRITSWNAAATGMFGYSAEEAVGQPVEMLIPHERQTEEMMILSRIAKGEVVPPFRTVRLARDGTRVDVSVQISPLRDALGRIVGGAKSARDLTHQRQIEQALRRSEARMRFALESAELGDWELDVASGEFSRSWRHDQCFGFEEPPQRWTLSDLMAHVHADDRAALQGSLQHAIDAAQPWHAQFRVLWRDASVHWLRMDAQTAPGAAGDQLLVGIVSDVTSLRNAEQSRETARRLEAENQRVLEVSRLKSQFMANMSHELRTPLNAVIGFSELLQAGAVPHASPKHGEYLGHIARSGRHLLQVINDVLDLSKVEAGRMDFAPEPIDLPALVAEVVATLGVQATTGRVQVRSRIEPAVHGLVLDPARLKQVLFNYLSNAIKFTLPDGLVEVTAQAEGPDHWRLEVRDTGLGIAPEDLPRLFVEFQQLDGSHAKRHEGTGLGLALTRRLVQAQGGRVGVYSEPRRGSLFYAVLPRRADAAAGADDPRVLVAAQDHPLRDNLMRGLAQQGIGADAASTTAEVVQLARVRRYNALALDLGLPHEPGQAPLAEALRGSRSADTPIKAIALSGTGGQGVALPVTGLIAKPLEPADLARLVASLTASTSRTPRVLVVDDDAMARELMLAALAAIGMDGHAVAGGDEALQWLQGEQPDAIVLDLMMPGTDGFQVLHALRHAPGHAHLPVFVWTAVSLSGNEQRELALSAQAVIAKGGSTVDEVVSEIVQWLRQALRAPNVGA